MSRKNERPDTLWCRAVKIIDQALSSLGMENHPGKTCIGRVEKGFDFLGYHLTPQGLSVAPATLARFIDRAYRLYEQERGKRFPEPARLWRNSKSVTPAKSW